MKFVHLYQAARCTITGCIPSSYMSLLSKTFMLPLQVTLTNFALFSYKLTIRLPFSFPIPKVAEHEVKPMLARSSSRGFAPSYPLMLTPLLRGSSCLLSLSSFVPRLLSVRSSLYLLRAPALTLLFLAKLLLLLILTQSLFSPSRDLD